MSKPSLQKFLRRKQRQAKELLKGIRQQEVNDFKLKQFFGVQEDKTYYPTHDPEQSNHRRVVGQRITSGRIKIDGYKKAKGIDAEGPTS